MWWEKFDIRRWSRWRRLLLHMGLIVLAGICLCLYFFYGYLHEFTRHGESVTVPDLRGIPEQEAIDFLEARFLSYKIAADSDFSIHVPPLTVLNQYPLPDEVVKEERAIILTLNATDPPEIKMPRLVDGSLKSAQLTLLSLKLRLGKVDFEPDLAMNAVLKQLYQGKVIAQGTAIAQGSSIDLIVGDGLGRQDFSVPNLVGLEEEEAVMVVIGSGLRLGAQHSISELGQPSNVIIKQEPPAASRVSVGDTVELWFNDIVEP